MHVGVIDNVPTYLHALAARLTFLVSHSHMSLKHAARQGARLFCQIATATGRWILIFLTKEPRPFVSFRFVSRSEAARCGLTLYIGDLRTQNLENRLPFELQRWVTTLFKGFVELSSLPLYLERFGGNKVV